MTYRPTHDLAGVDIIGERMPDGSIALGCPPTPGVRALDTRKRVAAFPERVEVNGVVFGLEFVKDNDLPINCPDDDPRRAICWGVYV